MNSTPFILAGTRIFVTGHTGMLGGAVCRRLQQEDSAEILTVTHEELDLRYQSHINQWMEENRPDVVIHTAGTVGGIHANSSRPAEFLFNNLMMATNVLNAAAASHVWKLLYLGSSCIYPANAPQPMPEAALLTGPLEPTNQWYAIAKIAGLKLCEAFREQINIDFISAMPCNLYGPGDTFDARRGHVIPMLMQRFHDAKQNNTPYVEVWGTGNVRREFLYVDDCADALVFLLKNYSDAEHINVGMGFDVTIHDLAVEIAEVVGYRGELRFNPSKPEGPRRKLLDISKLTCLGWETSTPLDVGLEKTYTWFL